MKGIVFPSAESTQVSIFSAIELDGLATLRPSTSTPTGTGLLSLSNWSAPGLQKQKKKLKLDQRQKEVIMPLGLQVERLTTGL